MEYYPFLRHVCNSYTFFLYDFCLIFFRIILKCLGTNPKQDRLHACHCFKVQLWSLTSHQPSITACCVPDELQMSLRWWWFLWHFCAQPTTIPRCSTVLESISRSNMTAVTELASTSWPNITAVTHMLWTLHRGDASWKFENIFIFVCYSVLGQHAWWLIRIISACRTQN